MKSIKKLPEITVNEWLEAEAEISGETRVRPPGAITPNEFAKMMGCASSTARHRLSELHRKGKAERLRFRQGDLNQGHGWVYWLKNGQKK